MRIWVKGLGVTLLVSAMACSSSGGGGGSVTSIPGSTGLATLTPAQTTQLCTDSASYITRNISKADQCKLIAFTTAALALLNPSATDADVQTACTMALNSCNSASSDGGATGTCSIGDPTTCAATATIDEYSKCVTDATAGTKAALGSIPTCSSITIASLTADGGAGGINTPTPASCTTLTTDCPGLTIP